MLHTTNGILDLLIEPALHLIDCVYGLLSFSKTLMVLVEVVEDVRVLSVLVVADLVGAAARGIASARYSFLGTNLVSD